MPRPAVRLLHAGDDDDRPGAARPQPGPGRAARSGRRSPARSAAAPATPRSSARCGGRRARAGGRADRATRSSGRRARRSRSGCHDRHRGAPDGFDDNDRKPVGHGRMLRKEDPRFVRGQGRYVDDVQLPGMLHLAILRSPARARPDRQHRHHRRRGAPEGQGGRHRRDAGRAGPGLDADAVQRRAGRAGHRQGPLPGPGGRVRRRRGPLRGPRRAGADRRRVRAAAAGDRRPHGARPGRPGDPRRPRGQDRQPLLRLGDRRRGGHRGGVRRAPTSWSAEDIVYPRVHPAPMETCGAVADFDAVERQAHALVAPPRPRTRTARCTRSSPACPSTRSG